VLFRSVRQPGPGPAESPALALAKPLFTGDDLPSAEDRLLDRDAPAAGSRRVAGHELRVRSYVKKDGMVVDSHTRAAPSRRK
jgi:hypothetical protein